MGFFKKLFGASTESVNGEKKQKPVDGENVSMDVDSQQNRELPSADRLVAEGQIAMQRHQLPQAVALFKAALEQKDDLVVREYLANVYIRMDRMEEALAQLKVLAEAEPDNIQILLLLGRIAYSIEDYTTVHDTCNKMNTIEADTADALYLEAQASIGEGNPVNAIALLTKVITLHPEHIDAYYLRGKTLLEMGAAKEALEDADHVLEVFGDSEDALLLKARVEKSLGNNEVAIDYYTRTIEQNPFSAESFKERGEVYYITGNKEKAAEDLKSAMEINPDALVPSDGSYTAEGVEEKVRQSYAAINPFGI